MKQKPNVFLAASSMITPLGNGTEENINQLLLGRSGVQFLHDPGLFETILPLAKIADEEIDRAKRQFNTTSRFDSLMLSCVDQLRETTSVNLSSSDVLIVLSTTKGNIELLDKDTQSTQLLLSYSANLIRQLLKNPNQPIVISNACISGLSSMIYAKRVLEQGSYKHALIIGCDVLTNFVISGFNSFHAISKNKCRPFDEQRDGINLGEAAAAVLLSTEVEGNIIIQGGCISNDANHISGPSKTGEELSYCIQESLRAATLTPQQIDFISAHGTATRYNDEMESNAFELAGLTQAPVFSLKANYGHTLGASGILEVLISAACLQRNCILKSEGFQEKGVGGDIHISSSTLYKSIHHAIKTASGFGGCNAALILQKVS